MTSRAAGDPQVKHPTIAVNMGAARALGLLALEASGAGGSSGGVDDRPIEISVPCGALITPRQCTSDDLAVDPRWHRSPLHG